MVIILGFCLFLTSVLWGDCAFSDDEVIERQVVDAGVMVNLRQNEELEATLKAHPGLATAFDAAKSQLMHRAAIAGNLEAMQILKRYGGSFEQLDASYRSPLHLAAFWNRVEMVEEMLDSGVDIESIGVGKPIGVTVHRGPDNHVTALACAASSGAEDTVRMLLFRGAKWDIGTPETCYSVIHHAMHGEWRFRNSIFKARGGRQPSDGPEPVVGNAAVIDMLMKAGADLQKRSCNGMLPIHVAAQRLEVDAIRVLVTKYKDKFDINATDRFGRSALTIATHGPLSDAKDPIAKYLQPTIDLLKEHGAIELGSFPMRRRVP